jgi:uncharacterized membrane protein YeiB
MALTNYLTQSVVLGLLFYGYGLGLVGRLESVAAVIGLAIYASQLTFSWWCFSTIGSTPSSGVGAQLPKVAGSLYGGM